VHLRAGVHGLRDYTYVDNMTAYGEDVHDPDARCMLACLCTRRTTDPASRDCLMT
jgi:hypothetical protein